MAAKVAGNLVKIDDTGVYATDAGVAASAVAYGVSAASSVNPNTLSPVVLIDPDTLSAGAVSSLVSGGTGGTFSQGTGAAQPTVVASILDSQKVLRFDGGDSMQAATGGASLASDWTIIEVRRHSQVGAYYQSGISWGDASGNRRRSPNFMQANSQYISFVGESADVSSTTAISASTWYTLATVCRGGVLTLWVNGSPVKMSPTTAPLLSFSAATIRLGANPGGSENLYGDIAYLAALPSALSPVQMAGVMTYLNARFASLTAPTALARGVKYADTTTAAIAAVSVYVTSGGVVTFDSPVVVGLGAQIGTGQQPGDSLNSPSHSALFSVAGGPAAFNSGAGGEHLFTGSSGDNVAGVWSQNANGYSAIRYQTPGTGAKGGYEGRASGVSGVGKIWGGPATIVTSNDSGGGSYDEYAAFYSTTLWGHHRGIQTQYTGGGVNCSLRYWIRHDGWVEWYDRTSVGTGECTNLTNVVMAHGLPPTATANAAVLTTRIPSLSGGPGGMLVVKDSTNNRVALYRLEGTTLTAIGTLDAQWTTTLNNPATVNVCVSGGYVTVQNNSGGSLNLTAAYYGA